MKKLAILILILGLVLTPGCKTPKEGELIYTAPYEMGVNVGEYLPGTGIRYVGMTDTGAHLTVDGQDAYKQKGDSLNWSGKPADFAALAFAGRVVWYTDTACHMLGTATLTIEDTVPQIVPTIKLLQVLGIHGTYLGIILFYSGVFLPFAVLLISGFVKSVPREIDESAMIDGCRPFHIFVRIVFPLLKPVFATSFVLTFMYVWNDFKYPLYLLRTSRMWTLQMSVFNFTSAYGNLWNYVFADLIMASLPVIIVYFLAQNFVISGLTAGAIKG